jgi:hypothetical protein
VIQERIIPIDVVEKPDARPALAVVVAHEVECGPIH